MHKKHGHRGFTLLELLITLAIAMVLLTLGLPDFEGMADKRRLRGAADALQQDLLYARSEAIKRNQPIHLAFKRDAGDATQWCYGMAVDTDCDCLATDCQIEGVTRIRSSSDYSDVAISSSLVTMFEPVNGTADPAGGIVFESKRGAKVQVNLSLLGGVSLCAPSDDNPLGEAYGYDSCP